MINLRFKIVGPDEGGGLRSGTRHKILLPHLISLHSTRPPTPLLLSSDPWTSQKAVHGLPFCGK